jgi:hypothetical protein
MRGYLLQLGFDACNLSGLLERQKPHDNLKIEILIKRILITVGDKSNVGMAVKVREKLKT